MKKSLLTALILLSTVASANCVFHVDSNLREHKTGSNGTFWAINKIMSEKGYSRSSIRNEADVMINLSVDVEKSVNDNILTKIKDVFDTDTETDYFIKFKRTTAVKVSTVDGELLSGSLSTSGKTVDNLNELADIQAEKSITDGAKLIEGLSDCSEL